MVENLCIEHEPFGYDPRLSFPAPGFEDDLPGGRWTFIGIRWPGALAKFTDVPSAGVRGVPWFEGPILWLFSAS